MFDFGKNARRSVGMKICAADDFNRIIDDTKVSDICAEIADLREQRMRGELNKEDFKKAKNAAKIKLPVFTFMSHYSNGIRKNENAVPSGLSIFDIDGMTEDPQIFFKEKIEPRIQELGIVLVHVSPSQEGLHIIFITPQDKTYAEALEWMGQKLGCEFDTTTKDPARCSFAIPRDYILYMNNEELFKDREYSAPERKGARGIPSPNLSRSTGEGHNAANHPETEGGNANPSLAEDNANTFSPARGGDRGC